MADKPSRALVLYGDAFARIITPDELHIHTLASRGICSLLPVTHLPPSVNEDASIVWDLAELLDARDALENSVLKPSNLSYPNHVATIAERFMGMKAAIVTDNLAVRSLGLMLGFKVYDWNEINDSRRSSSMAFGLLRLLGFEQGKILDENAFEFVLAHCGSASGQNLKLLDQVVGDLLSKIDSVSDIGSRLHLSVILSFGPTSENDEVISIVNAPLFKNSHGFSFLGPFQSFMVKAGQKRENIRQYCPLLLSQYQKAVTRVDDVESFSFRDFIEKGGNLITPADRFIHEVAFKLWKAPKYGA